MSRCFAKHTTFSVLIGTFLYSSILGDIAGTAAVAQVTQNTMYNYVYDNMGNRTQISDALGNTSNVVYDPLLRVKQWVQPIPASGVARPTTNFTYDGLDQSATVVDPRNLTTSYTIDGLGNQSTLISPDTGLTGKTFDNAGNLLSNTDARGKVTTYTYDALRRVTSIVYASGSPTVFEYDGGVTGAPSAIGRLTKFTDESGQTTYDYDLHGRVLKKVQTSVSAVSTVNRQVAYAYNGYGQLISMTYPSGNRVNYAYDAVGRINQMTLNPSDGNGDVNTNSTIILLDQISYAPFGAAQSWVWGAATSMSPNLYSRTYDLDGRVVTYQLGNPALASQGAIRTLGYDAANRITAYTHAGNPTASTYDQTFGYDGLGRLTSFVNAIGSQGYAYDASGNRIRLTIGATNFTNTISTTSNRLTATTGPSPARNNIIDSTGNLTSDGTESFVYSDRGRLQSVTKAGIKTTYLYNGLGQRVSKSGNAISSGGSEYVYDEVGQLIGEYDGTGAMLAETIWLEGTPVVVLKPLVQNGISATAIYNIYVDHLATARVITDASGKIVWSWVDADPWGMSQPSKISASGSDFTFNIRFPGQYFDQEAGLNYNYLRDYDPQTGRYVQSDPIGLNGGINPFAYVEGNPAGNIDFYGLAPGDRYNTVDQAGIQAIRDINPTSIARNREYAGRVYRRKDGSYSYTTPIPGQRASADFGTCPPGTINAGQYHTHGADSKGKNWDYVYSNSDMNWAERENVPSYLGMPDGTIGKYTPVLGAPPRSGSAIVIGRGAK